MSWVYNIGIGYLSIVAVAFPDHHPVTTDRFINSPLHQGHLQLSLQRSLVGICLIINSMLMAYHIEESFYYPVH